MYRLVWRILDLTLERLTAFIISRQRMRLRSSRNIGGRTSAGLTYDGIVGNNTKKALRHPLMD